MTSWELNLNEVLSGRIFVFGLKGIDMENNQVKRIYFHKSNRHVRYLSDRPSIDHGGLLSIVDGRALSWALCLRVCPLERGNAKGISS